jgi:hypothetical protein
MYILLSILLAAYLGLMVHYTGGYSTVVEDVKMVVRYVSMLALVPIVAILVVVFCIQYRIGRVV